MHAHDNLNNQATAAANALFHDNSVAPETTLIDLRELRDHIEFMIDCLTSDTKQAEEGAD